MSVVTDAIDAAIATLSPYTNSSLYLTGYGEDINCLFQISDWRRTFKGELLKQLAFRCITTPRGSYFGDPEYGIDVQEFLHSRLTPAEMSSRVVAEIRKLPMVENCKCNATQPQPLQVFLDIVIKPLDLGDAGFEITLQAIIDPTGITNV